MSELIKILKQIGLVGLLIVGLGTVGVIINNILPWSFLTTAFAVARRTVMLANWFWDIDGAHGLYYWLGLEMIVWFAVWGYEAYLLIIGKLHK